jgi:hypothetical protein
VKECKGEGSKEGREGGRKEMEGRKEGEGREDGEGRQYGQQ